MTNLEYVRYLRSGFEYFWNRFASTPVPTKPMMVPDRSRRALSIAHFIFLRRPPFMEKNQNYCPKTLPNREISSKSCADSFLSWYQQIQWWYPIDLDELYRLHSSFFFRTSPLHEEKPQSTVKKTSKTYADSFLSWYQQNQWWYQIDLDELYRFHTLLVLFDQGIN
jgi:hypothetical protein